MTLARRTESRDPFEVAFDGDVSLTIKVLVSLVDRVISFNQLTF